MSVMDQADHKEMATETIRRCDGRWRSPRQSKGSSSQSEILHGVHLPPLERLKLQNKTWRKQRLSEIDFEGLTPQACSDAFERSFQRVLARRKSVFGKIRSKYVRIVYPKLPRWLRTLLRASYLNIRKLLFLLHFHIVLDACVLLLAILHGNDPEEIDECSAFIRRLFRWRMVASQKLKQIRLALSRSA